MAFTGGDITEITYNHPELGSGTLFTKANEDGTIDLGGYRSNDDANMVTGNGQFIDQLNRVRGRFESPPIAWDMVSADELKQLTDMTESPVLADWTITSITGTVWAGRGKPVGDIQGNTNQATNSLTIAFEGKLQKIS